MPLLHSSDVVDGFTVQSLIKSNLYTETYRVIDRNGDPFFLKLFLINKLPVKLVDKETKEVNEISFCKWLSHRNIVSYIADGLIECQEGSHPYYVTNYFNGRVLSDVIQTQGALPEAEALRIFRSILDGLAYLHSQSEPLCHNDLDSSNVILSEVSGETVIIDLGHLSKRCAGTVWFDTADLNPLYHANETMVGIYDEQGDIFSACTILYELVTGRLPWQMQWNEDVPYKDRIKQLGQYRKQHLASIDAIQCSNRTKLVLSKGLAIKPVNRFTSVEEILQLFDAPAEIFGTHSEEADGTTIGSTHSAAHGQHQKEMQQDSTDFEIKRGGGNGFKDIAGMHNLKDYLYKHVIFILKDKEVAAKYCITPPNGMLLYGPPGCGKSFFAEKFAEETSFNFMLIKASDLGSSYLHGSQEKISKLFKKAEQNAPIVVCFDEFDAMVPDRSAPGSHYVSSEVNEFLSQMNNCSKRGIFIVATSNRPDKIDPAILRTGRIDKMVYVPLPDREARREMFKLYLENRPVDEQIDFDQLAEKTEGYIASDIAYIVNDAAMTAAYTRTMITDELLTTSVQNTPPSLREESLETYQTIRNTMERTNRTNNARTIVRGFRK